MCPHLYTRWWYASLIPPPASLLHNINSWSREAEQHFQQQEAGEWCSSAHRMHNVHNTDCADKIHSPLLSWWFEGGGRLPPPFLDVFVQQTFDWSRTWTVDVLSWSLRLWLSIYPHLMCSLIFSPTNQRRPAKCQRPGLVTFNLINRPAKRP